MFQGVHSTVIGDSHIRKGIVCQDSSGTVVTDQFAIAVVADGHGSAKHFRSDVGSRIAVKITTKLLKNYMNRSDFKEQFFKHPEFILAQMEKQILMKWREAVEEYHLENPLTKEEESKIPLWLADATVPRKGKRQTKNSRYLRKYRTGNGFDKRLFLRNDSR